MKVITNKQTQVLNFIKKFIATHGYPPAVREICEGMKLSSPATVHAHIKSLIKKGYLKQETGKFRTLEVVGDNEFIKKIKEEVISIPLLGKISCGNPIEAIENPSEFYSIPAALIPAKNEVFALRCEGDSMINVGIYDKDIVIVKKEQTAHNGQIVVAMTPDNEVTLKTFYKEKDQIRLQPENDKLKPIILKDCSILGTAIGLYRKL